MKHKLNIKHKIRKTRETLHAPCSMLHGKGFTIVELLVAMSLFTIFIVIASGSFVRALRTQRAIVSLIAANDNASLSIEQIAREIRTGTGFSLSANDLNFINAYNINVTYRLNTQTNAIERGEEGTNFKPITATNVKINSLNFHLLGQLAGDGYPPRITVSLSVSPNIPTIQNISTSFQTTVSARNLDT
ncbi:MAG: prepilin-type N-terminal cleavage/methylation domain-containing protein [bacterium]|nr:prepilin-type N-terminal cleavage/methylation domain-containing protein [bacterium]